MVHGETRTESQNGNSGFDHKQASLRSPMLIAIIPECRLGFSSES
jgi:hypothetical protein